MASRPFKLDRLSRFQIVGRDGQPTQAFQRLWQKLCETIEEQEATQDAQITAIAAALAAAVAAQGTATAAAREAARINSYTDPTENLSATDVGATATITIAAHSRVYPVQGTIDVADVSILAGSVTGLGFATLYHVYYDDTTLADTTPTFQATTDRATAQVGAAAGRHFVGSVTTPADGAGGTTGTGGFPPGGGGGGVLA